MSNLKLAVDALIALKASGFEPQNGYCARWCRQVCEFSYGDARFNNQWRPDASPTAAEAGRAFRDKGYAVSGTPQIGDILFKTAGSGGAGHVGILTARGVAENSTVHWNRSGGQDARGLRSLADWGAFQIVVRLPIWQPVRREQVPEVLAPKELPLLVWNGNPFPALFDAKGRPYPQLAAVIEKMGHKISSTNNKLDENPPRFYVNSK